MARLCLLTTNQTLDARVDKRDWGIELRKKLSAALSAYLPCNRLSAGYTQLATRESSRTSVEMTPSRTPSPATLTIPKPSKPGKRQPRYTQRLPFRRIFTRNVCITLLARFCLAFHVGTFNSLWFVFLSTPVYDPNKPTGGPGRQLPFVFTGGLGLPPAKVGTAMAVLGILGITLQLFVYPALSARLGTVRCLRMSLVCFPLTYFLAPYLSLVPSSTEPPAPKSGPAMWVAISGVLLCQVVGRTFASPNMAILVNNCSPHPSVLGTFHGLAQTCSSAARTLGPVLCGFLYGVGLAHGVIGGVWWGLSLWAAMGWLTSWLLKEGDGHEIWLDGDEEDEDVETTKSV